MNITRREKHIMVVLFVILIFLLIAKPSQMQLRDAEYAYLILIALPLGIYLATDPERKPKE